MMERYEQGRDEGADEDGPDGVVKIGHQYSSRAGRGGGLGDGESEEWSEDGDDGGRKERRGRRGSMAEALGSRRRR